MKISYMVSKIIKKIQLPSIMTSDINETSKVSSSSHVVSSSIDRYSYLGSYSTVIDTKIGAFCSIADNCIIGGSRHPIDWISSSPVFHEGKNILRMNFSKHKFKTTIKTIIGNDVLIGSKSLIKGGVVIGDGSIVGMGSVVTQNIGDYEIWAGNPARLIRKRFDEETSIKLKKTQWWNLEAEIIKDLAIYATDIEAFIKELEKRKKYENSTLG